MVRTAGLLPFLKGIPRFGWPITRAERAQRAREPPQAASGSSVSYALFAAFEFVNQSYFFAYDAIDDVANISPSLVRELLDFALNRCVEVYRETENRSLPI
jgi:hypothetical protein